MSVEMYVCVDLMFTVRIIWITKVIGSQLQVSFSGGGVNLECGKGGPILLSIYVKFGCEKISQRATFNRFSMQMDGAICVTLCIYRAIA